ncbi:MAG: ATP synthase F1 subunit epsilon [Lachnospiraceae bacterium]
MAENKIFELRIISPDQTFYQGESTFLEFTSVEGELGIYKEHVPLTTILEPCVMSIHNNDEVKRAAILGGFVEILKDKITVLAEEAQWPDDIDVARAEAAKKRAEERIAKKESNVDVVRAEVALKKAMARLNVAR